MRAARLMAGETLMATQMEDPPFARHAFSSPIALRFALLRIFSFMAFYFTLLPLARPQPAICRLGRRRVFQGEPDRSLKPSFRLAF